MAVRIVGIDPGISGALALCVDGLIIDIHDMPIISESVSGNTRNRPNPHLMADIFARWKGEGPFSLYIEKVSSQPRDSAVGAFAFGKGAGMLEGCAAALGIPYTLVYPQTWKRVMGAPADKGMARARACQLCPNMSAMFQRVKDDGRAESALLALYGYRDYCGMVS